MTVDGLTCRQFALFYSYFHHLAMGYYAVVRAHCASYVAGGLAASENSRCLVFTLGSILDKSSR